MSELVLKAQNLCKRYTHPVDLSIFHDISLELYAGKSVALTGKSGSGKTTLLSVLGTLEAPTTGQVILCDSPISQRGAEKIRKSHIGFIFQSYHLLEDYTVLENLLIPAKIARRKTGRGSPAFLEALDLLEEVGLSARADFSASLLSGGEKQRVAIARALCNHPRLILADEPSGNLDQANSIAIHTLLLNCARKRQQALLIATHDADLAALCDETYTLVGGELIR